MRRWRFRTYVAADGVQGLRSVDEIGPDVVLVSLLLPDLSGLEVCCRLRRRSDVPVLMLASAESPTEPEVGLDLGADDYVWWPQRRREMVARLRAVLRRTNGQRIAPVTEALMDFGELVP